MALSELEKDAARELLNVSVGLAANSLSNIVNEEVELAIPEVSFLDEEALSKVMASRYGDQNITAIAQEYSGDLDGTAILLFSEQGGLSLVRAMLTECIALNEITALEQEALAEVGNILLNACFGALANQLKMDVASGLPSFIKGNYREILSTSNLVRGKEVMLLKIEFSVPGREIHGYISFTMNLESTQKFEAHIRQFLGNVKVS